MDSRVAEEGYRLTREGPRWIVEARTPRGLLYGAYALLEQPAEGVHNPYFPRREWWSAAFQANFNLPLGGAFDRPIEEISAIVRRTIHEAPRYGVNTLQLMGRAGEGGIDVSWLIEYDKLPRLHRRRIGYGVPRRIEEIRALAAEAHRYGLDFLIWDHELVFPDHMLEAYPELRGVDYPICFSHPVVFEFLDAKLEEFFRRLPEVDGLTLTFAETRGYNILEHGGCRCRRCSRTSTEEKLRHVAMAVYEACRKRGRRMEIRSYNQKPEHARLMRKALAGFPADAPVVTKNTVVDFRGTEYPDDPMLGAFPAQPQSIELTACPEGSGYGYLPALLGDFYRAKIGGVAVERKLSGVALRTDYHLQYGHATFFNPGPPALTFDGPNEFNVYAASRLMWDPTARMEAMWETWSRTRYGEEAAPAVAKALARTAAITQGIFFVKGFSLLTHLNMVPHVDTIDAELERSYLTEYFPDNAQYRRVQGELSRPTEETIAELLAEKDAAERMARQSREEIERVRAALDPARYGQLAAGLRRAENAARLWRRIAEAYFRLRQVEAGAGNKQKLEAAARGVVEEACRIERESGRTWPVYPAARGITAYEFAQEIFERGKLCCLPAPHCR